MSESGGLSQPVLASEPRTFDEDRDYRPDDKVEWVIDVEFEGNPVFDNSTLENVFDYPWLDANGRPAIFGHSPDVGRWTYLVAADSPPTFTKLAFAWRLYAIGENDFDVSAKQLTAYQAAVAEKVNQLGNATLKANRSPDDAVQVAEQIKKITSECNRDVVVVLAAPSGQSFEGRKLWDVMMSLGLRWGDMDLFHWNNSSDIGDDFFFSVWTLSPPGYFFPEQIDAGQVQVQDLVFGYSIPRSADPVAVFDSMMNAVRYSQERLGGNILDGNGKALDERAMRRDINNVINRMNEAGYRPGEGSTLMVF